MLSAHDILPLSLATVVFPAQHPLAGQTGVINACLVRHPDGAILVDTGPGQGNALIDQLYRPVHRPLDAALATYGLQLSDVAAVVTTHLHFDHCGQNPRFLGVPLYVQRAEHEAARARHYTIREWVEFPGATYHFLEGDAEIAAGITLLFTPGHTPGHQSVLIETAEERVLLAGQAIYSADEYEQIRRTGGAADQNIGNILAGAATYRASAQRLLALAPDRVLFAHDNEVWVPRS